MPLSMGKRGGGGGFSAALMRFRTAACMYLSNKSGSACGAAGWPIESKSSSLSGGKGRFFGLLGGVVICCFPDRFHMTSSFVLGGQNVNSG
jgi:hypothetical protein